jgi:hypothetical protein
MENLSAGILAHRRIPLPPILEQGRILEFVRSWHGDLGLRQAPLSREIDLVREYRERLVSGVVTGKVDVRHLAPERVDVNLEERAALGEGAEEDEELAESGDDECGWRRRLNGMLPDSQHEIPRTESRGEAIDGRSGWH